MSLPVLSNLFVYCVGVPQKWSADFVGECRVFQWCEQIKRIMGNCILFMYSAQLWYTYKDYCVSWLCPVLDIPKGAERSRSWICFWPRKTTRGLTCSVLSWKCFGFDVHISFLPNSPPPPPSPPTPKDLWHIELYMWGGELDKVMWKETLLYWNWCILIFYGSIILLSLFYIYLYI
jgi:hypothetical protein